MGHLVAECREWTDPEPDIFSVSLERDGYDNNYSVVVSGNATWLTPMQALEASDYMSELAIKAEELNVARLHEMRRLKSVLLLSIARRAGNKAGTWISNRPLLLSYEGDERTFRSWWDAARCSKCTGVHGEGACT